MVDVPDGYHKGSMESVSSEGPDNKFAPGEPGISGNSDVNFAGVALIRYRPASYKSDGDIGSSAPLT